MNGYTLPHFTPDGLQAGTLAPYGPRTSIDARDAQLERLTALVADLRGEVASLERDAAASARSAGDMARDLIEAETAAIQWRAVARLQEAQIARLAESLKQANQ